MSAAFLLRASDEDIELLEDSGVFALEEILEEDDHVDEPELGSETRALVAACLASVREVARLEDAVVFPPLPAPAPRREVVVFQKGQLAIPTPGTIVRESSGKTGKNASANASASATTQKTARSRASRWPVVLCAVVALASATAAFYASPAAERTGAARVTRSAAGWIARTAAAAASAVAR